MRSNVVLQFEIDSQALTSKARCADRVTGPARHATTRVDGVTTSVPRLLHDAILGLHREDSLRRAYVRSRWLHCVGSTPWSRRP
jgi:hypothetical protein